MALNHSRNAFISRIESWRRWRLEMDALLADRAGHNLHRAGAVVTPGPYPDFASCRCARSETGTHATKEPFGGERLLIVARRVEHHFNDALDIAVCGLECADIHSKTAGNRGPDLFSVQLLPLDLAAFEHVGRQGLQYRLPGGD